MSDSIETDDDDEVFEPDPSYSLEVYDLIGIGFHIVGGMFYSLQQGLHAIGVEFAAAANHARAVKDFKRMITDTEAEFEALPTTEERS